MRTYGRSLTLTILRRTSPDIVWRSSVRFAKIFFAYFFESSHPDEPAAGDGDGDGLACPSHRKKQVRYQLLLPFQI
jgi:hypothetical protein